MVKVSKIAVWKIGNTFIEDQKKAEREVRRVIAQELIEQGEDPDLKSVSTTISDWIAENHDKLEAAVKSAMAGA